ncbi:MAG: aminoglycoside phosphotransferase family protein [Sporichthyaceae bacterium]|nr:aminoglycoside phosphotransferase family protein [Sporichthyaceae bacterium]
MAIGWNQAWRAEVDEWISDQLVRLGRRPSGEIEQIKLRSWSLVLRVPAEPNQVWFKAGGPGCAYEAGLVAALAGWVGRSVLGPLAVDRDRGWLLLPDGGPTLRSILADGDDQAHWERLLPSYAELQRELSGRVDEMLALGVPDQRPRTVPVALASLLADTDALMIDQPGGMTAADHDRMPRLQPEVAGWAKQLDEFGIAPSLNHDDFHDGNVFLRDGHYVFFDWGDASVSHPFASLLVTLNVIAHQKTLTPGSAELIRMRDAYLEPWSAEHDHADLVEAARLATRLGKVGRSLSWRRALIGGTPEEIAPWADGIPGWLTELFEPDLI